MANYIDIDLAYDNGAGPVHCPSITTYFPGQVANKIPICEYEMQPGNQHWLQEAAGFYAGLVDSTCVRWTFTIYDMDIASERLLTRFIVNAALSGTTTLSVPGYDLGAPANVTASVWGIHSKQAASGQRSISFAVDMTYTDFIS